MTQALTTLNYMPVMGIEDAVYRRDAIVAFTRQVMTPGTDYGAVPGTDKPTLLKPGAEKLCTLFGLTPRFELVESVTDWNGRAYGEPFFYFHYRCLMYRGDALIASGEGSCNSMESKYRYRWVPEAEVPAMLDKSTLKTRGGKISEFTFAVDKGETTGQYGKPAEYWQRFQDAIANKTAKLIKRKTKAGAERDAWEIDSVVYRVPNPDVADQVNTIQKMGQKRALIAATLIAVNASEFYTQDMEDFAVDPDGAYIGSFVVRETTTAAPPAPHAQADPVAEAAQKLGGSVRVEAIVADAQKRAELSERESAKADWAKAASECKRLNLTQAIEEHKVLKSDDTAAIKTKVDALLKIAQDYEYFERATQPAQGEQQPLISVPVIEPAA